MQAANYSPGVATQVRATRQRLGQVDMAALVASVKAATLKQLDQSEVSDGQADAPLIEAKEVADQPLITTKNTTKHTDASAQFFQWPGDLNSYKVSTAALARTQSRFADRLTQMGIDPTAMPKVEITYGHPDGMRRNCDGSFTITASRRTQNKRHQINKTKLWQNTRRAMSLAYLDTLATARPDLHHQLQSTLDASHQSTKHMLATSLAEAQAPVAVLALSLQISFWHSVPQKLVKKRNAEEYGQASFETLKDWRSEAAFVLAEAHKSGWPGMAGRNKKARRKFKSAIARHRNQLERMRVLQKVSARLSGKRRRIIRDIMAAEDRLRAIDQLEHRQKVLRQHFPL